ncbi:hypothetical protein Areg01_57220 [Actinoplanes regularis]|nr:hypothetical protein Areg01_57220 [Actinoplanes regularis]
MLPGRVPGWARGERVNGEELLLGEETTRPKEGGEPASGRVPGRAWGERVNGEELLLGEETTRPKEGGEPASGRVPGRARDERVNRRRERRPGVGVTEDAGTQ